MTIEQKMLEQNMLIEQTAENVVKVTFMDIGRNAYFTTVEPQRMLDIATKALSAEDITPDNRVDFELVKRFYEGWIHGTQVC